MLTLFLACSLGQFAQGGGGLYKVNPGQKAVATIDAQGNVVTAPPAGAFSPNFPVTPLAKTTAAKAPMKAAAATKPKPKSGKTKPKSFAERRAIRREFEGAVASPH